MDHTVYFAFFLTILAGLSTGVGSCIVFIFRCTDRRFLSASLGFSAGVMIYVSMIEIFFKARDALVAQMGIRSGSWITAGAFFGGMLFAAMMDKLLPSIENSSEIWGIKERQGESVYAKRLMRMGAVTALAIAVHNFPEGMATFVSALQGPGIALPIVVAVAIHNIPEGMAVSVPVYQATGSKWRAFLYSFLSGLAEPAGALLGWLILQPVMDDTVCGLLFGSVAGIMVFISFNELLPAAREYGEHHISMRGLILGMVTMAASLLLFL